MIIIMKMIIQIEIKYYIGKKLNDVYNIFKLIKCY